MKLIDKDTLVTEIENRIKKYTLLQQKPEMSDLQEELQNKIDCLNSIKGYILNTLEVKEVDFGTEVYKYIDEHFNVYDDGNQTLQTKDKKSLIGRVDVENIAKHFFELGIKAQKGEKA